MRARFCLTLVAVALSAAACEDSTGPSDRETFRATLTGAAERPTPVTTTAATGNVTVLLNTTTKTFTYTMNVSNISGVTAAHIHGPATVDQPAGVIVPLASPTTATVTGTFAAANITAATVSVDSLIVLLRAGRTYVNVHTSTNPGGEIRGQLIRD